VQHWENVIRENGGEEYYNRWKRMHDHPWDAKTMSIGLARIRLDGFVSLDARDEKGILTTRPLVFDGNHLVINADATDGSLAVEIQDAAGSAIDGYALSDCRPLNADAVRHTVRWSGGAALGTLSRQPVRLRFVLKNAKLYAFGFKVLESS